MAALNGNLRKMFNHRIALIVLFALLALGSGCSTVKPSMKASPSLMNALGMAEIPLKDLKKQYMTEDSRFVEVDELEIHYQDVGEGPVIVLVHGIMSSLQTWNGWVDELRGSYRVISLDVPGYGLTGAPANMDEFSEEYIYQKFEKFVDYIDLEKFSIAGNSMGGYIAARYAAEHADRVERLILLNPTGYPQEHPWIFQYANTPVVATLSKFAQPPFLVTMNVKQVYGDTRRLSQDNHYRYIHMSQRPGAKAVYLKTLQMMTEKDEDGNPIIRPTPFAGIRAPTLLMWGEVDEWTPIELAERWKQDVRNLKFISYPTVGHVPMEEMPYQTAQDALAFLSDLNPNSGAPSINELEDLLQGDDFSEGFDTMEGF